MTQPTLLLTRPAEASARFAARVSRAERVVISPLLEIVPTGTQLPTGFDGDVIFTSVNAVNLAGVGAGRRAFCVGARTAKMAEQQGWVIVTSALDADDLVTQMVAQTARPEVIHLCGKHRRGNIAERLTAQGFTAKPVVLYDQRCLDLTDQAHTALTQRVIAPVFSPRTAQQLALQQADLSRAHLVAFSPAVAAPLNALKMADLTILPEPRGDLMVEKIEKLLCERSP